MRDKGLAQRLFDGKSSVARPLSPPLAEPSVHLAAPTELEVGECAAFGFLRGLDARALAVEFRFLNGNCETFSYNLLASWRFNPSAGLLLKFTSDVVTLVLIRGSNLDAVVSDKGINLTNRGLQRHRVIWITEMDESQVRHAAGGQPTIERIEIAEFESNEEAQTWLQTVAPVFVRGRA